METLPQKLVRLSYAEDNDVQDALLEAADSLETFRHVLEKYRLEIASLKGALAYIVMRVDNAASHEFEEALWDIKDAAEKANPTSETRSGTGPTSQAKRR